MYSFNQNDLANQSNNSIIKTNFIKKILTVCFVALVFAFSVGAANAATYTVTTVADNGNNVIPTSGSLRAAIFNVNNSYDASNTIVFSIGSGLKTITPPVPLPVISHNVVIDGTTQPGFSGSPLIEINGANAVNADMSPVTGLALQAAAVTVRGLIINRFSDSGIAVYSSEYYESLSVTITGNYIGTNAAGTAALGNGANGILVSSGYGTVTIGGTTANDRNIISGNLGSGISAHACQVTSGDVFIKGNYIGTDNTGNNALGNAQSGILQLCSKSTTIGGTTASERNIISGNNGVAGVELENDDAVVQGNYIGTNVAGTADLGNVNDGVFINRGGTVGGASSGAANVISGNNGNGIKVTGGAYITTLQGNKIGTNALGTAAIGNSLNGVDVLDSRATIGGTNNNEGNLISGNGDNGIKIEGANSDLNIIKGNRIGVANNSLSKIPNTNSGIFIGSKTTSVGEAGVAAAQNIIAGNFGNGIRLSGTDAHNNVIENNFIGTNLSGTNLGNTANGIEITNGAHDNRVGGSNGNAANTIVNSSNDGVNVNGSTTVNNAIQNNIIYSNGELGIDLGTNGVTANDAGDGDTGANNLQNFPVITAAYFNHITATLNSQPNKSYTVEFYRNNACDSSGNGEGQFYLGSTNAMTDASGNATINAGVTLASGQIVSATATDANGNTSEFAQCFVATVAQPGALSFSAATYTVNENAGTATIGVMRSFGSGGAVSVQYATSNGTATAGQDYTATSGTLNWADADSSVKTFTVPIINDSTDEPNETINLTLSNPGGGANLLAPSTAVLTITDDDNPPTISVSDVSKLEGNQGTTNFTFNITLSAASAQTVAVDYTTANGTATAGIDYNFGGDTIVFNPGQTSVPVNVAVNGDTLAELDETFFVNLADPQNATLQKAQGIGTILDDDNAGKLQFTVSSSSVSEGASSATIFVNRANGTAGTVSVDYVTSNGTATAGQDYTAVSGTLVFLDGQNKASFNVPILQDNIGEADETIFLTLSNPSGGATLGNPSSRTLTILDDDGGLPANVFIGGRILENGTPLPNVLVTLAGSQSKTALTDGSGNYNFANLPGGGNYLVTPTLNGHTFEPFNLSYNNLAANVTNANFIATTGTPARLVRIINGDTVSGNSVVVPIELVSQGNENSVGFSLNYDANLLSNAQISLGSDAASGSLVVNPQTGKIGVIVALPSGQNFVAGNRQVATVTFQTAQTALYSTPVGFGDAPIARETTDQNAGVLPTAYADGAVTFAQGYEADVAPRPTGSGNGSVTVADFTMVGKFVAGTLTPDQLNEFQRADCAPRATKGNGVLTVSDYTQAGRYAAALDAVQTAGGASVANLFKFDDNGKLTAESANLLRGESKVKTSADTEKFANQNAAMPRVVRVVNTTASANSQVLVSLEVDANGDENGFGFTLNYDANKLSSPLVVLGTGAVGATLIPNVLQTGKVGVVLAMPTGQTIQAGTKQLVTIRFNVAPNATGGLTPLTFSDAPVFREVVDANADTLTTTFTDGNVNILAPTAAGVSVGGRVLTADGRGIARAFVTLTDGNGGTRSAAVNAKGGYHFADVPAGETYILTVNAKGYQFTPNTRVLTFSEDVNNVNFTADN